MAHGWVHDSQTSEEVLRRLAAIVKVRRSPADAEYSGGRCLHLARDARITPMFDFRADSLFNPNPLTVRGKGHHFEVRFP